MVPKRDVAIYYGFLLRRSFFDTEAEKDYRLFSKIDYQTIIFDIYKIKNGELKVKTKNDLDHLRSIAEDKTQWRRLSANIREAAESYKSEQ